jgi:hypothetical protein
VTHLLYIAQKGNLYLFVEFLKACSESNEDVAIQGETILACILKKISSFSTISFRLYRLYNNKLAN